jgi:hypothetical protein
MPLVKIEKYLANPVMKSKRWRSGKMGRMVTWIWDLLDEIKPVVVTALAMAAVVMAMTAGPAMLERSIQHVLADPRLEDDQVEKAARDLLRLDPRRLTEEVRRLMMSETGNWRLQRMHLLHRAVEAGSFETAAILIEAGIDINGRDDEGMTPLDVAIDCGSPRLTQELLAAGASPALFGLNGETALSRAVRLAESSPNSYARAEIARLVCPDR